MGEQRSLPETIRANSGSMRLRIILFYVLALSLSGSCKKGTDKENDIDADPIESYVLLVSFDGFRWDYADMYETPNFDQLASEGVKANRLIPSSQPRLSPTTIPWLRGFIRIIMALSIIVSMLQIWGEFTGSDIYP